MAYAWLVTGIGVKKCQFVDPQRAPGVRNKWGFEERTVSVLTAATGRWSRTQWHPTHCIWRSEEKARDAYAKARAFATNVDPLLSIQMAAVQMRQQWLDCGGYDPSEAL